MTCKRVVTGTGDVTFVTLPELKPGEYFCEDVMSLDNQPEDKEGAVLLAYELVDGVFETHSAVLNPVELAVIPTVGRMKRFSGVPLQPVEDDGSIKAMKQSTTVIRRS